MVEFWGEALKVLPENNTVEAAHHVPLWVKLAPLVAGLGGVALAYLFYMAAPGLPAKAAQALRPLYLFSLNKWYFDELYDRIFVRPAHAIGHGLWKGGDGAIIDGLGPDGVAATTQDRKSVVEGKSVEVRGDLGGRRLLKKKKTKK